MLLIAALIMLPSLSTAAENATVVEQKPTPNVQPNVTPPQPVAAQPPAVVAPARSPRVGYVDMARIASESDKGKALKATLTARKGQLQKKIDEKKKQLEKQKTTLEAKVATMTPAQRETKAKEFQKKVEEFQKFGQKSEEELLALQEKESRSLYDAIEQVSGEYGTNNGFTAIVIKKELLFVGKGVDAVDVTDSLIKSLITIEQKKK
jgi:outer membrane protein